MNRSKFLLPTLYLCCQSLVNLIVYCTLQSCLMNPPLSLQFIRIHPFHDPPLPSMELWMAPWSSKTPTSTKLQRSACRNDSEWQFNDGQRKHSTARWGGSGVSKTTSCTFQIRCVLWCPMLRWVKFMGWTLTDASQLLLTATRLHGQMESKSTNRTMILFGILLL